MIRLRQCLSRQVAGLVLAACFSLGAAEHVIEWRGIHTSKQEVVVTGFSSAEISLLRNALKRQKAEELFPVRMDVLNHMKWEEIPQLAGTWAIRADEFVYQPRYPLGGGMRFIARFQMPGAEGFIQSRLTIPTIPAKPRAAVAAVYPSAEALPENLLKFYLHFTHPMSRGDVYRHITLLDERELPVELPFLEIGEELWDPEQRRLTLLIDPGRIKRGVKPLEDIGPAMVKGKRYTLHISQDWQDGRGVRMIREFRKAFRVTSPDRSPVNPLEWRIIAPKPDTRQALEAVFSESLDHALASRVIWIEDDQGEAIEGDVKLSANETRWQFTPTNPWGKGRYHLRAELILEDLAGNSIGRPFEVDVFERVDDGIKELPFGRPFTIGY